MTENDAEEIVAMIENHWQRRIEGSRRLWVDFLVGQDAELAVKAVGKLAATEGYMPRIKDMREMLGVVTPSQTALEAGICPTCHGDRIVLVQTRPAEASLWMTERGIEPSRDGYEETAPCPDCNAGANTDYHLLGHRYRPLDEVTIRQRMEPMGGDPRSPRSRDVPDDVAAWLEQQKATLLKSIP